MQGSLLSLYFQTQLSNELKVALAIAAIPAVASLAAQIAGLVSTGKTSKANAAGMTVEAALAVADRWEREANRLYAELEKAEQEYDKKLEEKDKKFESKFSNLLDLLEELINGNIENVALLKANGITPAYERKGRVIRGDYNTWLDSK